MAIPALRVLILTEDSSPHAHDTLAGIVKKTCRHIEGRTATHRIAFEPAGPRARQAMRATEWRRHKNLVDLRRRMATRLLEDGPPTFVLFHVDGDTPWEQRKASQNRSEAEKALSGVVRLLEEHLSPDEARRLAQRCIACVPFYSIEAWLYQNTDRVRRYCMQRCRRHAKAIDEWEVDRGRLDELIKPKDAICIGSKRNTELCGAGFDPAAIEAAGKSYAAFVSQVRGCLPLRRALASTVR